MAAVIDLRALDTVTRQTISSRTSIILNSLPLPSPPPSLPADLNIYSQVFILKPAFMCKRTATQAAIPGKISSLIWKGEWLWQLYSGAFHSSSYSLSSSCLASFHPSPSFSLTPTPPSLSLSLLLSFAPLGPSGEPQGSGLRHQQPPGGSDKPTDSWMWRQRSEC